jgi:hypothetical protein
MERVTLVAFLAIKNSNPGHFIKSGARPLAWCRPFEAEPAIKGALVRLA